MSNEFVYSQNYNPDKLLIQTFGRGSLPKYVEPNLSQRNTFQQEKIIRQKYAHRRDGDSKPKQKINALQHRPFYENQRSQTNQMREVGNFRNKAQFDNIDHINDKINGLIKSISMSCHKKDIIPLSNKIQKSETLEKFKKKDTTEMKREKLLESAISKKNGHTGFDSFGAKQQPSWFKQEKNQFTSQNSMAKHEKKGTPYFESKKGEASNQKREDQDEIQQRIKKIQDKISVYERKMGTLQPSQYFKKPNMVKPVEKQQRQEPREVVDYLNTKYQMGTKYHDEFHKKQERTAKKQTNVPQQRQSNRKLQKEKDSSFMHEKQNKREEKVVEIHQTKGKHFHFDKHRQLQTNKKNHAEKQENQTKFNSSSKKSKAFNANEKSQVETVKLDNSHTLKNHQKSTFIKSILTQIQFDQDFRHAKHMFGGIQGLFDQTYQADRQKWIKLRQELKKQGFSLSINEVKQIFMPRDDEIDPFMSVSHSHDELIHGVIFAYRTAQKHWNDHIYRSWTLWELKQANFTSQNLDRGKKGFISLQDLTFYINTEVDGNNRNRDLLLIFHRLGENSLKKSEHAISFKVIIDRLLSL